MPAIDKVLSIVWMVLGVLAIIGGLVLFFGNRTGHFPTFHCAGTIALLVGSLVMSIGKYVGGSKV